MITPLDEAVSTKKTSDETHSFTVHKPADVISANSSLITSVTSKEVARHTKAATDPPTKKLEWFCDIMEELWQVPPKRNEEITGLI